MLELCLLFSFTVNMKCWIDVNFAKSKHDWGFGNHHPGFAVVYFSAFFIAFRQICRAKQEKCNHNYWQLLVTSFPKPLISFWGTLRMLGGSYSNSGMIYFCIAWLHFLILCHSLIMIIIIIKKKS